MPMVLQRHYGKARPPKRRRFFMPRYGPISLRDPVGNSTWRGTTPARTYLTCECTGDPHRWCRFSKSRRRWKMGLSVSSRKNKPLSCAPRGSNRRAR